MIDLVFLVEDLEPGLSESWKIARPIELDNFDLMITGSPRQELSARTEGGSAASRLQVDDSLAIRLDQESAVAEPTRLRRISYAVFCLKKKKKKNK